MKYGVLGFSLVFFLNSKIFGFEILNQKVEVFENNEKACKKRQSCNLKRARMINYDYKVTLKEEPDPSYNTKAIFEYETKDLPSLEEFVFVQFIRGCFFESRVEDNRVKKNNFWGKKESFASTREFRFPKWSIDSVDEDPTFNSPGLSASEIAKGLTKPSDNRHYLYQWSTQPDSYERETRKYYGIEIPIEPKLYVRDNLGSSYYIRSGAFAGTAYNRTLEFKMCIFKANDVPVSTYAENISFAKPLHCFERKSSFVFDHENMKFIQPKRIDSFCRN